MGKFEKVLIASDFDGTLKNDDGIITDDVRSAIAYFISEGGYFTVCTGRTYQGFHLYDPSYINAPVLLTNGSMAYEYEKIQLNKIVSFDYIDNTMLSIKNALGEIEYYLNTNTGDVIPYKR